MRKWPSLGLKTLEVFSKGYECVGGDIRSTGYEMETA